MPLCNICDESFHTDSALNNIKISVESFEHEFKVCHSCLSGNVNEIMEEIKEIIVNL